VIGEIAKSLAESGLHPGARVLWMPTGALGLLPIGLAQDPATGRRFGDIYEIVTIPSLEASAAAKHRLEVPMTASHAAVINPTGDIEDLDLPYAQAEGVVVASHFPLSSRITLDGANAEPGTVLDALASRTYWHFASHGAFDWSDARQSGLLMRGKKMLTVGELLDRSEGLGRPRLVVLSACETGLFEIDKNPDEFVGLPIAFMQAGAAGVVSSLWQVDDLATALLMARFYDLHLSAGLAPPAALKRAQVWLRNATRAELIAYVRTASRETEVPSVRLATLVGKLTSRSRGDEPRSAATWSILQQQFEDDAKASGKALTDTYYLETRPFEHPIYWGRFVYTGL
jgi:CHAT domain-containing protein